MMFWLKYLINGASHVCVAGKWRIILIVFSYHCKNAALTLCQNLTSGSSLKLIAV